MKKIILLILWIVLIPIQIVANENTIYTLIELKNSQELLYDAIDTKMMEQEIVDTEEEKNRIKEDIKLFHQQLSELKVKFEKIATGVDTSTIQINRTKQNSTIGEDLQLIIKPLIYGAKQATADMRKKAKLQEESEYYQNILPKALKASESIEILLKSPKSKPLKKEFLKLKRYWKQQITLISSNLNASLYQLDMLEKKDLSFSQSLKISTKEFFEERGRFLLEGAVAFVSVITILEIITLLFVKLFPKTVKSNRNFYIRFGGLVYKIVTLLLSILAPMGVFYYEEDWVLFSMGLLALFGIAWTFRHLMPKLWQQTRLLLNIGSVREEERIYYQNLPWRVKNINIFTVLENPDSGVRLRIPIEEMVGLTSRPSSKYEPWFPCRINDWVLLSNEYYGKVVGVSLEFIELVDVGGGHRIFIISDFLSLSPLNLSTDFRIISSLGISYRHQKEATREIPEILERFILKKIIEEGYKESLKKLIVQFDNAGDSSLNIKIIANFKGESAPLYFRLKRAIARWSVEACSQYNWEIPFPQMTLHRE